MLPEVLPLIEPNQYAEFQKIITTFPATYDEWHNRHTSEKRLRERQTMAEVPVITVTPQEFREHLLVTRKSASEIELFRYAMTKGAGLNRQWTTHLYDPLGL